MSYSEKANSVFRKWQFCAQRNGRVQKMKILYSETGNFALKLQQRTKQPPPPNYPL